MESKFLFPTDPEKWQAAYTADNAYYDAEPISSAASLLNLASLVAAFLFVGVFLFASPTVTLHLFDLGPKFIPSLDEGQISPSLREAFSSQGLPFTDTATLTVKKPGSQWSIQDENIRYNIQLRGEILVVKGERKGIMFLLRNLFLKNPLFALGLASVENLDAGTLSDRDRGAFAGFGNPLSANAVVVVKQPGVKWLLLDGEEAYLIQRDQQSLIVYENRTWLIILAVWTLVFVATYLTFKTADNSAFRRAVEFFREFYLPPEGVEPAEIIAYRIGGRIKLPMPFSEWFSSISQFKYILAPNGEILKKDEWPAWMACNIGGPILLIVFDGSALYLERGNRFSRVVGPGVSFLERHETIKYAVDLRNKVKESGDISVWTKDGIKIQLSVRIEYRLGDPQKIYETPNLIYPYDPAAVKKAIERHAFRWPDPTKEPSEFTWEDAIWGQVTGIVPGYIGSHVLDELLIADSGGGQILSPAVIAKLSQKINDMTQPFGVHVLDFQIFSIELDKEVKDHYFKYWEAERQSLVTRMEGQAKAFAIRAQEKAKADAQRNLILTIADGLKKNDGNFTEALLLSLSEVLDHGLSDPYMRSYTAKETIETLEKIKEILFPRRAGPP